MDFIPNPTLAAQMLVDPGIKKASQESAGEVLKEAQRLVAVDTGETHDSLHVEDGPNNGTRVVVGGAGVFLEFGTVDTAAQPFLRPALTSSGLEPTK